MIPEASMIQLDAIRIDGSTQARAEISEEVIDNYKDAILAGVILPPVTVFFDGTVFWLADGFHRYDAYNAAGKNEMPAEVHEGTQRDAILYSVGANASHGLRRSREDKRRAVMTLLTDLEWATWSNEAVARACNVSPHTVASVKSSISANAEMPTTRTVERNGKTYEQNTANIGKAKPVAEPILPAEEVEQPPAAIPADDAIPPPATPAATPAPVPFDEVHALRERFDEMAASFKNTLADNEMMGRVCDADPDVRVGVAMKEAVRQKAIADNAERSLAAKNGEFVARAEMVTHWMNRAQKAEKALAKLGAAK